NWGRAQRRAVSQWYTKQNPSELAMAVTKYQNREGYTHRDVLRLSHPSTKDPLICFLFDYITHGLQKAIEHLKSTNDNHNTENITDTYQQEVEQKQIILNNDNEEDDEINNKKLLTIEQLKEFLETVEKVKTSTDENELITAIRQHHLVREHLPTNMLNSKNIWAVLLENMPLTAMAYFLIKLPKYFLN
ncbi:unnamed protein product, partial [Rotaria sp. Silwood1]